MNAPRQSVGNASSAPCREATQLSALALGLSSEQNGRPMLDRKEFVGMALAESGFVHPSAQSFHAKTSVMLDVTRSRWTRLKPLVLAVYYAATVGLLAAAGYPRARVMMLIGVFASSLTLQLLAFVCMHTRMGLRMTFHGQLWHIAFLCMGFALTGGLQSPLLVIFFSPIVTSLVVFGRGGPTRAIASIMLAATVAMLLLPQAWFGPRVAEPYAMYITVIAVFTSVLLMWTSMTALVEAFREKGAALLRAREEVMEQALARAKGLEQVGSKVAHELKNPLAAVKGLVQLMARNCPGEGKSKERLAVIEREVARMETILGEYLSFSRPLEDLNAQDVDVDAVATDVIAVLEARAQAAQVTLSNQGHARVIADPRRLKEALLNLVANALEFTPPGGKVDVNIEETREGGARLTVRDNGKGMTPEVLERVGTPFFTTREAGTGLGVTLARAVFTQHGGELRYESQPGAGTTATALLPPRAPSCPGLAGMGKKIDGQAAVG